MVRAFFDALYPSDLPPETALLLWSRKPNPSCPADGAKAEKRSWWCKNIAEAVSLLARQVPLKDADWYLGNGLSNGPKGAYQRAKANEIVAIPGLWIDADVADPGHKKQNLPQSIDHATALLNAMPLPPTLVIHSGGGLQGWWLFDKPWVFSEAAGDHAAAAALTELWNKIFIALCAKEGLTADSVHDLARVFRIPGTFNVKLGVGDLARPTRMLSCVGPRFAVEEIMHEARGAMPKNNMLLGGKYAGNGPESGQKNGPAPLPSGIAPDQDGRRRQDGQDKVATEQRGDRLHTDHRSPEADRHAQRPVQAGSEHIHGESLGGTAGPGTDFPQVSLTEAADATIDNLTTIPKFEATWDRRRGFADNSLSSYDAALSLFCVNAGVDDRVTREIIRRFRLRHGQSTDEKDKGSRQDYLDRTIATAKNVVERDRQEALERFKAEAGEKALREVVTKRGEDGAMVAVGVTEPAKRGPKTEKKRSSAIERLLEDFQEAERRGESQTAREALLGEIGRRLGARIDRLICYKAEPSSYVIVVEGEEVPLGGIENLYSYHRFMLKVADGSGAFFPAKVEGWESIVRALHAMREIVLVGEDGTDRGLISSCVEEYMLSLATLARENVADALRRREPFVKNGQVYVILAALRESVRDLQNMSVKTVASALIQWGAVPSTVNYARGEGDGIVRTTTRAYILPEQERWARFVAKSGEERGAA